jgi:hypothetical protein
MKQEYDKKEQENNALRMQNLYLLKGQISDPHINHFAGGRDGFGGPGIC